MVTGTLARIPDSSAASISTGLIRVSFLMKLNTIKDKIPQKADFIGV